MLIINSFEDYNYGQFFSYFNLSLNVPSSCNEASEEEAREAIVQYRKWRHRVVRSKDFLFNATYKLNA